MYHPLHSQTSTTFYQSSIQLTRQKKLLKFKTLVTVLAVNDKIIDLALASDFKDFEDALQYFTAIENNIKVLLTRILK